MVSPSSPLYQQYRGHRARKSQSRAINTQLIGQALGATFDHLGDLRRQREQDRQAGMMTQALSHYAGSGMTPQQGLQGVAKLPAYQAPGLLTKMGNLFGIGGVQEGPTDFSQMDPQSRLHLANLMMQQQASQVMSPVDDARVRNLDADTLSKLRGKDMDPTQAANAYNSLTREYRQWEKMLAGSFDPDAAQGLMENRLWVDMIERDPELASSVNVGDMKKAQARWISMVNSPDRQKKIRNEMHRLNRLRGEVMRGRGVDSRAVFNAERKRRDGKALSPHEAGMLDQLGMVESFDPNAEPQAEEVAPVQGSEQPAIETAIPQPPGGVANVQFLVALTESDPRLNALANEIADKLGLAGAQGLTDEEANVIYQAIREQTSGAGVP